MNNDHNDLSATWSSIQITPEQAAENIKVLAGRIRGDSSRIRDIVRTLHTSGALEKLADAIREAAISTSASSREINETAKQLKDLGVKGRKRSGGKTRQATKRKKRRAGGKNRT